MQSKQVREKRLSVLLPPELFSQVSESEVHARIQCEALAHVVYPTPGGEKGQKQPLALALHHVFTEAECDWLRDYVYGGGVGFPRCDEVEEKKDVLAAEKARAKDDVVVASSGTSSRIGDYDGQQQPLWRRVEFIGGHRRVDQALLRSQGFADLIFQRIRPFLDQDLSTFEVVHHEGRSYAQRFLSSPASADEENSLPRGFGLSSSRSSRGGVPCLSSEDAEMTQLGYGWEGRWTLHSVNSRLSFIRYRPGDVFYAHGDANQVEGELSSDEEEEADQEPESKGMRNLGEEGGVAWKKKSRTYKTEISVPCLDRSGVRSLFTLLLYLNADFDGGETRILSHAEANAASQERGVTSDERVYVTYKPPGPGSCLIFFQKEVLHEGLELRGKGAKYVIRSDIFYENQDPKEITEEERQANEYLRTAIELEAAKRFEESWPFYKKAFRLNPVLERLV